MADRQFLDPIFRLFRGKRVSPQKTEGTGGTAAFSGYLVSNEKDRRLIGREKYLTFSNMLANVSIVAAGTRYFLNLTAKAAWRAEPAEDGGAKAEELAELIEDMMNDMSTPWFQVIRRAAMYKFQGFSIQEWTAKRRDDGLLGMMDIEPRPQVTIERWDLDASGTVFGVVQRSPQTQEEIYLPRGKLVYMCDDSLADSPEGLGLFRHCVKPSDTLCRYELLEAFGYETDLKGMPVVRAPLAGLQKAVQDKALTQTEVNSIRSGLEGFVQSHNKNPELGMILDSAPYRNNDEGQTVSSVPQWDLELLKGDAATSQVAVAAAIVRLNQEMARILGVEGLLLGGGQTGSLALSKDKTHNFALIIDSTLAELRASMQKDFVETLFDLNGWDKDLMPTLKTEVTRYRDVDEITGALVDMASAGAIMPLDDPAIGEVRDLLGLSRPDPIDLAALATPLPGADPDPAPTQSPSPGPDDDETPESEDGGTEDAG